MIGVYLTNLGKYNEGQLSGEWLTLPASTEGVQALLARIGVDGVLYEGIFITDYDCEIEGLSSCLGEHESLDELNYLAALLDEMDKHDLEKFEAAVACGDDTGSVKDLINLTQTLDWYVYFDGVHDAEELGRYLVEERGMEIPANIEPYFDYEEYGRDEEINYGGMFASTGFVARVPCNAPEHYSGRSDLPDEHKIFAYPKPEKSIKKMLANYKEMADGLSAATPVKTAPSQERG